VRTFAQQPGQLGDVRFFDPAPRMPAGPVRAGVTGPALAHLAALIDGDLPGLRRDQPDRGALAGAQLPADGVGQLVPGPGGQLIQRVISPRLVPAPSAVTISRRRNCGGSAAIASPSTCR